MNKYSIALIVGSLRKESFNLRLSRALARLAKDKWQPHFLNISDLPLYNQDLEKDFPRQATRLKEEILGADGVLFVTPEYNRSIPGPLKNAIDWASRPYGKNAFAGKPAALCGTSPGAIGTACSQHTLHSVCSYLDMKLMGQPEVYLQFKENLIDGEGTVSTQDTEKFLQKFADKFTQWVAYHAEKAQKPLLQQTGS